MNQNDFSFCPICGTKKINYMENKKWKCSDCGFTLYNNVASAVGIILSDNQNNILLEVRAKEPKKGFLALPGGFCDQDETAEEAATRECKEETGFEPKKIQYLCSFPNDYEYKNIKYKTCDLFFTAKLDESSKIKTISKLIETLSKQNSEVLDFKSVNIKSQKDIDSLPLAFESARKTLSLWLEKKL